MLKVRPAIILALAALLVTAGAAQGAQPQKRVINGTPATADGQYPWTVALVEPGTPTRAFCGGTLIAQNAVLTAAHCTIGRKITQIRVVAGRHDLSTATNADAIPVDRISLHPLAEAGDDAIVPRRDVSILTLDTNAPAPAAPIALGDEVSTAVVDGAELTITGWGVTENSADTVAVMRSGVVQKAGDAACEDVYDGLFGDLVFSPIDQLCAYGDAIDGDVTSPPADGQVVDTCQGDSGGPLARPLIGAPSATTAAHWELVGATSWGAGCALVFDDGTVAPGVYARVAAEQLRAYAAQAIDAVDANADTFDDDAPAQPEHTGGVPGILALSDGSGVFCSGNDSVTWTAGVEEVDYLVRRRVAPGSYETVAETGVYFFDQGDYGDVFVCELHGRDPDAGGYGLVRSAGVQVQDDPGPTVVVQEVPVEVLVHVPIPMPFPQPVIVPGLPYPVADPRSGDVTAPRTRSIRRSCSRRLVCTFTIRASDAGAGVKTVHLILNTVRTRPCTSRGRRTTCASWRPTVLRARAVVGRPATFRATTKRLARGSHAVLATAIDLAGNAQRMPRRLNFTLR